MARDKQIAQEQEPKFHMVGVPPAAYGKLKAHAKSKGMYIRKVLELAIDAYVPDPEVKP